MFLAVLTPYCFTVLPKCGHAKQQPLHSPASLHYCTDASASTRSFLECQSRLLKREWPQTQLKKGIHHITDNGNPIRVFFSNIPNILADWADQPNKLWGIFRVFLVVISAQILSLCIPVTLSVHFDISRCLPRCLFQFFDRFLAYFKSNFIDIEVWFKVFRW